MNWSTSSRSSFYFFGWFFRFGRDITVRRFMLTKWLAILLVGWVLRHGYFASQLGTPDFTKDNRTEGWEWSNGGWWSCGDSLVGGLAHGFTKTGWTGSKPEYVTYVSIYMQNIRICKPLLVCICLLFISRFHIMVSWMIRMNMNMFLWMLWNHWVDSQAASLFTVHLSYCIGFWRSCYLRGLKILKSCGTVLM